MTEIRELRELPNDGLEISWGAFWPPFGSFGAPFGLVFTLVGRLGMPFWLKLARLTQVGPR